MSYSKTYNYLDKASQTRLCRLSELDNRPSYNWLVNCIAAYNTICIGGYILSIKNTIIHSGSANIKKHFDKLEGEAKRCFEEGLSIAYPEIYNEIIS